MLSKRFVDDDGRFFFFDKVRPHLGVRRTTPKQLFVESHLYSEVSQDGQKDVSVELWLSGVEARAESIIEKVLGSVRRGSHPKLTLEEKADWDFFFFMQWRRVPDLHR
jgi:hypothetical protein